MSHLSFEAVNQVIVMGYYEKIKPALDQYGVDVYDMTLFDLQKEFGDYGFPSWLVRYSHDAVERYRMSPFDLECALLTTQLWQITEECCYVGEAESWLDTVDDKAKRLYFTAFIDVFTYKDED